MFDMHVVFFGIFLVGRNKFCPEILNRAIFYGGKTNFGLILIRPTLA